jgi:site-specific recombinase XerD
MARTTTKSITNLEALAVSFARHLRAANRSPRTVRSYLESVAGLDSFLAERGMPRTVASIAREHVESYIEDQLARFKPTTALVRFKSLQQFFRWLVDEGEITASPMDRMRPPKAAPPPPAVLRAPEVKSLLAACAGSRFEDRRDTAVIALFYDTGLRLSELINLKLRSTEVEGSDVDLDHQLVYVVGKGSRPRALPIGAKVVKALDRYERIRGSHPDAALPDYWLGRHGRMTASGVQQMLRRRASEAGLPHLNPHAFRHTFAHEWLSAGGAETDLMMVTGWQSRSMLSRYGASAAAEQAREAHRRLSPADRL